MILEIAIYIIASVLSLGGLLLTVISIPGVWLIYISTILIATIDNFQVLTPEILLILFSISLLSTFIDNIVNALGVKVMGGTIWGMIGAILGGIVGVVIGNLIGLILGPILGAFFFEYSFGRQTLQKSLKAGIGSFVGMLLTILIKTGVNVGMIIYVVTKLINK
jgi:uncharacterized protein YqgC (DUF456 family)